jgi:predicted permease
MFETLGKDLRFAARMLLKSRSVSAVAVLSLALGLGGVTALFSLIDAVMLRRLPVVSDPGALVTCVLAPGHNNVRFSYRMVEYARQRNRSFSDLLAFTRDTQLVVRAADAATAAGRSGGEAPAEPATGQLVSGNFFRGLGVRAAVGRLFTPDDDRVPGGHPVAVISDACWQRRFGGAPDVVGRVVTVNGAPFTIVGVTPPGFFGVLVGVAPDYYLPIMMQQEIRYRNNASIDGQADNEKSWVVQPHISFLQLIGRLRPGVAPAQARAEMDVLYHQFAEATLSGADDKDSLITARQARLTLQRADRGISQVGDFGQPLAILMCAAALVLLIACANIANLLLARATGRRREIAVRLSIGAARGRLVRQLLTESVLLAAAGGACGVLVAFWGRHLLLGLVKISADDLSLDAGLDLRMLAFTAAASLCTALLFGLVPALQATRVDLGADLKEGGRTLQGGGGSGRSRLPLGRILVVAQVGLSLLLLIGAGLFLRSLGNLDSLNPGFSRDHLLLVRLNTRVLGLSDAQLAGLYQRLADRVTALPGVRSASLSLYGLVSGSSRTSSAMVAGFTAPKGDDDEVQVLLVTPRYFETVGMRLLEGRALGPQDRDGAAKVAVINETMARYFFPGQSAVGHRFGFGKKADEIEIVGVVRDAKVNSLKESAPRMAFQPVAQAMDALSDLEVRSSGSAGALAAELRAALHEVAPNLPVTRLETVEEQIGRSLVGEQAVARLTAVFGILALALAGIGLYGVMAFGVARRTNEIGLRMALGAHRGTIIGLVFREAMLLTLAGIAIGLPVALAAAPLAKSQLFGLKAGDPPTLTLAAIVMLGVAAFTGLLPAQRAASVDPMVALRAE